MIVSPSRQGRLPSLSLPSRALLIKIVRTVLSSEKAKLSGEINIVFVDNPHIRKLNRQFLGEKGETDVIAFGYKEGADVFISVPVARDNARRFNEPPARELVRLVVHGLLHVVGYADHKAGLKKIMWNKQERLVNRLLPFR